jgi:hypothetical protein
MRNSNTFIPLIFLITGFVSAYLFLNYSPSDEKTTQSAVIPNIKDVEKSNVNPFFPLNTDVSDESRFSRLEHEIELLKQQLLQINETLESLSVIKNLNIPIVSGRINNNRTPSILNRRLYTYESLIRGGIDQITAEDIVRRKNNFELKRLALQDRATRENYLNTQQYYDELNAINQNDISLREEFGDDRYDEYLFTSKQNNRIKIASVMLGSAAEEVGIKKDDVVLSYDNQRMFTWQELKDATTGGSLGEFVSINIYREGEIYSFTVPRGPLGIQLGATRLAP